jgi:acyl-CoA thioester hydrolase
MIPEGAVSYSFTLKVGEKDIDALKHVNNVVYLKWVNDISERHWKLLATPEVGKKYLWVVLRHELDYLNQATLDQEITLITWVGDSSGVKSVRHVQAFKGEIPLFKARSTWCLLDAKTLRPTRIKEDILSLLSPK